MSAAYLDHAASTTVHPEVVDAMLPWLSGPPANPSGSHQAARAARRAIDDARDTFAELLGRDPATIVFTSGGTESDNLAVLGATPVGHRAVCSAVAHRAVLAAVASAAGAVVAVDPRGRFDLDALAATIRADGVAPVGLVSALAVNNEIGTIEDLDSVAARIDACGCDALLHADAVQAFGWVAPSAFDAADLISLSAHKFGGPVGVGVLVVAPRVSLRAQQVGGGQERERRAGTQNVAGIVGAAVAARLTEERRVVTVERVRGLRTMLLDGLAARVDDLVEVGGVKGHAEVRDWKSAGNAHVCFPGIDAEALLFLLDRHGVAASFASSCASGAREPSHVLAACGVDRRTASGALRLTLGWSSTPEEVERAVRAIVQSVEQLRSAAAHAA